MKLVDQLKQTKVAVVVFSAIMVVLLLVIFLLTGEVQHINKKVSEMDNRLSLLDEQVGVWYVPISKEPAHYVERNFQQSYSITIDGQILQENKQAKPKKSKK